MKQQRQQKPETFPLVEGEYSSKYRKKDKSFSYFVLGVTTTLSLVFGTTLGYVLFCPHFHTWRESGVTVVVEPPKVFLHPVKSEVVNKSKSVMERVPAPRISDD